MLLHLIIHQKLQRRGLLREGQRQRLVLVLLLHIVHLEIDKKTLLLLIVHTADVLRDLFFVLILFGVIGLAVGVFVGYAFAGENGAIVGALVSVVAIAMLLGKLLR